MALSINDIKVGVTILVDDTVFVVIDTNHVKPGKGSAFVRAKVRNLKTAAVLEKTFRGDEKIEHAFVEERKMQYLYNTGDMYHFMDQENFEEIVIARDALTEQILFLKDNLDVIGFFYNGGALNIRLPLFVVYTIAHTEPGIKGDTAKSGTKPAQIETGAAIQVPLFVDVGDKIKVDTRTGGYVERA